MKKKISTVVFIIMFFNIVIYMMVAFLPAEATKGYETTMTIWGITAVVSLLFIIGSVIYESMIND
jgi:hypothetical protein